MPKCQKSPEIQHYFGGQSFIRDINTTVSKDYQFQNKSTNENLSVHQFKFFTHNLRLFGECFVYSRKFPSKKVYVNLSPIL